MDTTNKTSSVTRLLQVFGMGLCLVFSSGLLAANYYAGVFEFQKKLANNGNPQAQYKLASMYEQGNGTSKDLNQAMHWYKKSAENNYKMASLRLTYLDVKKDGFKSSHKPWLKEVNQEAQKGNAEALFLIGELYEGGIAVKKDLYSAKRYYKKASSRGNVDAETRLFELEAKINQKEDNKKASALAAQQNADLKKAEDTRLANEKVAKEKERVRANSAKKSSQLKLDQERKRLKRESNRLAAEKRKLEMQKQIMQQDAILAAEERKFAIDDEDDEVEVEEEKDDSFESDLCSGRAARFRTQCN